MDTKLDEKRLDELAAACQESLDDRESPLTGSDIADLARCAKAWARVERMRGTLDFGDGIAVYIWQNASGHRQYSAMATAILAVEFAQDCMVCPDCVDGSETVGDGTFGGTEIQSCSTCGGTQRIAAAPEPEVKP